MFLKYNCYLNVHDEYIIQNSVMLWFHSQCNVYKLKHDLILYMKIRLNVYGYSDFKINH